MTNKLWLFPLRVARGSFQQMPADWRGAVVNFYVGAPTHQEGLLKAMTVVHGLGLVFVDLVDGSVSELDPGKWWDGYVIANFPDQQAAFPRQDQIRAIVDKGQVFHGPFVGGDGAQSGP